MNAVSGQLRHDGASFDRSIADNSDRTPYVDDGGWPPTGSRSSINDQIERVAKGLQNLFSRRGRRAAFTIRTGAGQRPESAQEITQWLPGTETDADRASPCSHRIGESNRCWKDNGERTRPEGGYQYVCCMGNASNELC